MPRRANATRAHVRLAAQRHLACLALHLPTLPFEPQDPWPFLLQAEGLGVGEGGVSAEMCVGTGLHEHDMQPYRACSPPPPPPPRRCSCRLLCDADLDPDLICDSLFGVRVRVFCWYCCDSSFSVCKVSACALVSICACVMLPTIPVGCVLQIHVGDAFRQGVVVLACTWRFWC